MTETKELKLCGCGCGQEITNLKNTYIKGHFQKIAQRNGNKTIKTNNNIPKDTYIKEYDSTLITLLDMSNIDKINKNQLLIKYLFMKETIKLLMDIKDLLKDKE